MKIYFAGSIRGGREHKEVYSELIGHIKKYGAVLSEHVGSKDLTESGEKNIIDSDIYRRDMRWISESDAVIADISHPSHGVGYEIRQAEMLGKKILLLFRDNEGRKASAMLTGNDITVLKTFNNIEEAFMHIDNFFRQIAKDL